MINPRYSLGHGDWFVPYDMRKHYGEELLDAVNKHEPNPLIKRGIPLTDNKLAKGGYFPKPSVGRIVHYRSYGTPNGEYEPEVRAAIITAIHKGDNSMQVSLCVLNPTGMFFNEKVNYSVSTPGCWSWPPRD